ncbi:MAG: YHS domain-containing protein [Candidatus Krumholzibacteria bacterium]|nr:YHS domain-containing protein [Candidatus Krumholzibacteria bacterium]
MKRILVVLLAVMLVSSLGCGKKQTEDDKNLQTEAKRVGGGSLVDPVDQQVVDVVSSSYSFIYKEMEYNFNSRENMEAFMKDPEKYLKKD